MIKNILLVALVIGSFVVSGCSSTSSEGSGGGDVADGTQALVDRDLGSAETEYCGAYDEDATDEQAAFGCFLAKTLLLPETADSIALLDAFNQDHITIDSIFDDVIDAFMDADGDGFDEWHYTEFEILPFHDILSGSVGASAKLAGIVSQLVDTETTHDELIDLLAAEVDDLEELESLLDTVLEGSTAFVFTIPAELFNTDSDLSVTYNDVRLMAAGIKLSLVNLGIIEAYDFGVEPETIMLEDGSDFDDEALLADLNGAGGTVNGHTVDSTVFLTLVDESAVTSQESRCAEALELAEEGLQNLVDGDISDFLEESVDQDGLETALEIISDLAQGYSDDELVVVSSITRHPVAINLKAFFDNPPSATNVTDTDPFINDDEDGLRPVEAFFSDFLDGIASF